MQYFSNKWLRLYASVGYGSAMILALLFSNLGLFMVLFVVGALIQARFGPKLAHLPACVITCQVQDITSGTDCNIRGGLKTVYWALYDDIDWATMAGDPLQFDTTDQKILGYTMIGGATFSKLTFERKQGQYEFNFTEDADVYEQAITLIFEGKGFATRNAFASAVNCCKLVAHIFDNNCQERIVGVEWDGVTFEPQIKTLRITGHLDASGETGSSKARDELILGGESVSPPLYGEVTEVNIPVA